MWREQQQFGKYNVCELLDVGITWKLQIFFCSWNHSSNKCSSKVLPLLYSSALQAVLSGSNWTHPFESAGHLAFIVCCWAHTSDSRSAAGGENLSFLNMIFFLAQLEDDLSSCASWYRCLWVYLIYVGGAGVQRKSQSQCWVSVGS